MGAEEMVQVWDSIQGREREVPFSDVVEDDMKTEEAIEHVLEHMDADDWGHASRAIGVDFDDPALRRRFCFMFYGLKALWKDEGEFEDKAPWALRLACKEFSTLPEEAILCSLFLLPHCPDRLLPFLTAYTADKKLDFDLLMAISCDLDIPLGRVFSQTGRLRLGCVLSLDLPKEGLTPALQWAMGEAWELPLGDVAKEAKKKWGGSLE